MAKLEESVRSIEQPGLVWGASKLVPIGYGIKKLQITIVVEDELVSLDDLQERVAEFEDYVQSSDVAAMQSEFSSLAKKTPCSLNCSQSSERCTYCTLSLLSGRACRSYHLGVQKKSRSSKAIML